MGERLYILFVILTACAFIGSLGCKQAYDPPVVSSPNTYLVVEGFINNGPDTTYYSLSHTYKLSDTATAIPELQALVTVQGKDNSSYPLTEMGNGVYGAPLTGLNSAVQYRLDIRTIAGKEYTSDYVDMKVSPPIDSVSWTLSNQGVEIYDNTHDPQGNSRYYRWQYQETWEFNSAYYSTVSYTNGGFVDFPVDTFYTCWQSDASTSILLASSTKLAQDQIQMAPLEMIPKGDWRLSVMYSILVKQYVLTPDAYAWWQLLQKNTEQIGSIFGVEPSTTGGNIHNVSDSTELVIGYVSAGTLAKQRIYITDAQVSPWDYVSQCTDFNTSPDSVPYFLRGGDYLINQIQIGAAVRYNMSFESCVNCTLIGTNHKPSFWP
jgi:Domain of unknown function (DUF4249)